VLSGVDVPRVLGIGVGVRHRFVRTEIVLSLLVAMVIGTVVDVVDVVPLPPDEVGQFMKNHPGLFIVPLAHLEVSAKLTAVRCVV
jgi:hypothetical protein